MSMLLPKGPEDCVVKHMLVHSGWTLLQIMKKKEEEEEEVYKVANNEGVGGE